jgi:hypothetical protein
MRSRGFSLSNLSIRHRLPLLIGMLVRGTILGSTWASYPGVRESAFEVGPQWSLSLTQQPASLSQLVAALLIDKTVAAATDPTIRALLQLPSPVARPAASTILEQFTATQDKLGVNACVVQPVGSTQFVEDIKQVGAFSTLINEPPRHWNNGHDNRHKWQLEGQ